MLAAAIVEINASAGHGGFEWFTMAFVQAGFLLAGAFFIVSAIGNFLRHQTAETERRVLRTKKVNSGRFINHPKSGYSYIGVVH